MPQIIEPPIRTLAPAELPRLKWNITQYESLFSMGFLEDGKYERIEGDIVEKMAIQYNHGFVQAALLFLPARLFGQDTIVPPVSVPIGDNSLPEPDLIVTKEPRKTYVGQRYLLPADIRLVAEIADATLASDLTRKAALYARAQIAEYWVLDVAGRRLLVHQTPGETGYDLVTEYDDTETVTLETAPNTAFAVADLLP